MGKGERGPVKAVEVEVRRPQEIGGVFYDAVVRIPAHILDDRAVVVPNVCVFLGLATPLTA